MNIFALDNDPLVAARFHMDRHVAKQILECAQILGAAHIMLDGMDTAKARLKLDTLRTSHVSHPAVLWARECLPNYYWTVNLMGGLIDQYVSRFKKAHNYQPICEAFNKAAPLNIEVFKALTPFVQTFPATYRHSNPVYGWRAYYIAEKQHLAVWTPPAVMPGWFRKLGIVGGGR